MSESFYNMINRLISEVKAGTRIPTPLLEVIIDEQERHKKAVEEWERKNKVTLIE